MYDQVATRIYVESAVAPFFPSRARRWRQYKAGEHERDDKIASARRVAE
jgi:hypothetical protein